MDLEASEGLSTPPPEVPGLQPVPAPLQPPQEGEQDAAAHPPAAFASDDTDTNASHSSTPTGADTNTAAPAPGTAISAVGSAPEVSSITTSAADTANESRGGGGENGEAGGAAGAVKDEPSTEG
ncbi:unnamed protein product, partial [Laminaria digitata]